MAPGKAQYHAHLGGLLTKTGDLAGAEAAIREAIGLDAERAGFHHSLGHVLRKAGRIDEAIAEQRRATLLDGGDPRYSAALDSLIKRRRS